MSDFPMNAVLPVALASPSRRLRLPGSIELMSIDGDLRALTLGTLTVDLKDKNGNVIDTLSFSSGTTLQPQITFQQPYTQVDDFIDLDVTGVGVGAAGLQINVWGRM